MGEQAVRKYLSDAERHCVYHYLLENTTDGKLRRGAINDAAIKFGVNRKVITTIRRRASKATSPSELQNAIERRSKKNAGRKPMPISLLQKKVEEVPVRFRGTIRDNELCWDTARRAHILGNACESQRSLRKRLGQ